MNKLIRTTVLVFCFVFSLNSVQAKELVMATAHWPPWVIIEDKHKFSGINIDLANALAKELDLDLVLINCSWASCINLLKAGKSDILDSLLKRPKRLETMLFIDPPYKKTNDKVVYINESNQQNIKEYDDLYSLEYIGVSEGTKYSKRFDSDEKLKKYPVAFDLQLFSMLDKNRLDAFIIDESIGDYMITRNGFSGKFKKTVRFNENQRNVFFALSKNSPHAADIDKFNTAMAKLIDSGLVEKLLDRYTHAHFKH
jgi:polar amino acid transport system substrate-binding protein